MVVHLNAEHDPAGQPIARAVEPFNNPKDLTPREPVLPKGPHRELFMDNCTVCHSTRLTMTQPSFPQPSGQK